MKIRSYSFILLMIAGLGLISWRVADGKEKVLIDLIMQGLGSSHYDAVNVDDKFSEQVYDIYVERLDYNKRFLLKEDVKEMKSYRDRIDDEINASTYQFFNLTDQTMVKRTGEAKAFWQEILEEPFDFKKDEVYEGDPEKMKYATDSEELKERWRKSLKFQTLSRLVDIMDVQEKAIEENDSTVERLSFAEMEEKAREKVRKSHEDWFKRMEKQNSTDRRAVYLNAIANTFDPHTGYFPPRDKENFDISMSGRLEGIGATLTEKGGYIEVSRIVPGSPCYLQGELEEGDKILKVAQGKDEPVDVVDMRLDDAVQLIRGKKGSEVRLTVKHKSGDLKVVPIIRDVVILEETYAKSALLESDMHKGKIGYIKLPKFYADFNRKGGRSCSDDVAKEIKKLKEQNINGMILDLRNNGGGSLADVVSMAGLFIESGPIVQVNSRMGAPQILRDRDSRVQYEGPLIVMVNEFSASASEIMAAAMQDYGRAVIVGSPQTYGKGTVQRFFDLDRMISGPAEDIKPLGAVKLTTQKFYRINGGSTQLKGVSSDIVLPDIYDRLDMGEKELDYSLEWDEIAPLSYGKWEAGLPNMDKLRKKSRERVESNDLFGIVDGYSAFRKSERDETTYSLNLEAYRADLEERNQRAEELKEAQKPIEGLTAISLEVDIEATEGDTVKLELAEKWRTSIKKDAYIYETCAILNDM